MRLLARIVGEGGLLGSHLRRQFPKEFPRGTCRPRWDPPLPWDRPAEVRDRLAREMRSLLDAAPSEADAWAVFWCAGAGVVQTPAESLEAESRLFESFLADLADAHGGAAPAVPGLVVLASSAGAVYGESAGEVLTEESPCRPLSAYGREKLRQEEALRSWSASRPGVRTLVCRYSTLYGPGQNLGKPQGFISQLTYSLIVRRSLKLYVPFDTQRDFLHAGDAADRTLRCASPLLAGPGRGHVTKLVVSGRSVSLGEIIAILSRVARQPVRVLSAPGAAMRNHPGKLRYRSVAPPLSPFPDSLGLVAGIYGLYQEYLRLLQQGRLPRPQAR